jgi:TolB protein
MRNLLAVLVLSSSFAFAQRPVIEISGATFRPMPLAVAVPQTQDEGAKAAGVEFDAALTWDLAACGLFQVLDRKSFLADPKEGVTARHTSTKPVETPISRYIPWN